MVEARSKPVSQNSSRIRFQNIFEQIDLNQRKTAIIGTLGPSCYDQEKMGQMLDAGMNVVRLNFGFGDHKSHGESARIMKQVLAQRGEKSVGMMLDTKGPSLLTGTLKEGKPVELRVGQQYQIVIDPAIEGDATRVSTNYAQLCETVQLGSRILIDNGALECEVTEVAENGVMVEIKNNYVLGEKRPMHLPGAHLDMPVLSDKDELDIVQFAVAGGLEMVAISLVRSSENVETVRQLLNSAPNGDQVRIISKIENSEGLNNFEEILALSDGIMIMRQNLGLELPAEKVFIAQKWMIEKANLAAKPVICATQIFDSMIENERPTDSEASDISTCIFDGADAIMLNDETSTGEYPVQAVSFLSKICAEAERCIDYKATYLDLKKLTPQNGVSFAEGLAATTVKTSQNLSVDLIVVQTDNGVLPRWVAKYRPSVPILACSLERDGENKVIKQLSTCRGVIGFNLPADTTKENLLSQALSYAKEANLCKAGRKVLYLHGMTDNPNEIDQLCMKELIDVE